jgi:hypothetical protein
MNKDLKSDNLPYKIDVKGSLGLLALGDIGIRAWRDVKQKSKKENNNNESK